MNAIIWPPLLYNFSYVPVVTGRTANGLGETIRENEIPECDE